MTWFGRVFVCLFGLGPLWAGLQILGSLATAWSSPSLLDTLGGWPLSVMLVAFGSFLVYAGLFAANEYTPDMRLGAEQNLRKWGIEDPEAAWRAGRIRSRGRSRLVGAWVLAVASTVFVAPTLVAAYTRGVVARDTSYLWWCVFALAPGIFVSRAVMWHLRWRKYGTSVAELRRRPSSTSEDMWLTIRPGRGFLPPGEANVSLRLTTRGFDRMVSHSDSRSQRQTRTEVLWHETKSVPVSPVGLDVSFTVPADRPDATVMPASESAVWRLASGLGLQQPEASFHWTLEVRIATAGIDYEAVFDLPIRRS